jgi:fumarate hydratase class II
MTEYKTVHDSMGELQVPADAFYGAQTQRALQNFPISGLTLPPRFIQALGLIKHAAATANQELGLLDKNLAAAIRAAADDVAQNKATEHFPLDVFQTGSGTSTNMNANEVIATLAAEHTDTPIHPNDHVNMSQSSNDVIPTAINVSAAIALHEQLLPALTHLAEVIEKKAASLKDITKTGRTHLMDAMPVRMEQELGGWAMQVRLGIDRIKSTLPRLYALAQGGTAVGTGINAHADFSKLFVKALQEKTHIPFTVSPNFFESLSSQDTAVELSGQLKVIACSLMKIANDLRWMNSGPLAGLGEISLPALQPGSSIMPGKVNPVIPEAVCMVAAQVIGNDAAITVSGQSGNFQLLVMLPVIAYNLLQSIHILANAALALADKAIAGFTVNKDHINEQLSRNPILVTALNRVIGYELGAKIAKIAYKENRSVKEVALENTQLSAAELDRLLDPAELTKGGIKE